MKQSLSSTRAGYDLLAPKFDFTPYRTPENLVSELAKYFPDQPTSAIDICCGTGAGIQALVKQPNLERIVGIDFSSGMLSVAQRNFDDDRLHWLEADVLEMEFEEGFDLAICLGALGHFEEKDYPLYLERVYSLLNPGGEYLFVAGDLPQPKSKLFWFCKAFNLALWVRNQLIKPEFIMYYHRYMFISESLMDLLKQAGFTVDVVSIESSGISDGLVDHGFKLVVAKKDSCD